MALTACAAIVMGCRIPDRWTPLSSNDADAVGYSLKDLGVLNGEQSNASGINDAGQVVGRIDFRDGEISHAFLYSRDKMRDLGTLGGTWSCAFAISNSGTVAGGADIPGNHAHAFTYRRGKMHDLGTPKGTTVTGCYAINDRGEVAGDSHRTPERGRQAVVFYGGGFRELGTLGGKESCAGGINNSGQVVGWAENAEGIRHAFLFSGGKLLDLGTLGGRNSYAGAVGNAGHIVGWAETATGARHAYVYNHGRMRDLGTLGGRSSMANGVNRSGKVVGWADFDGRYYHGFVWSGGKMADLNDLLDESGAGWVVESAAGINNSDQIAATAYSLRTGETHAVLLTPVVRRG
jgi:probable HAF family extracellular repeat protein